MVETDVLKLVCGIINPEESSEPMCGATGARKNSLAMKYSVDPLFSHYISLHHHYTHTRDLYVYCELLHPHFLKAQDMSLPRLRTL